MRYLLRFVGNTIAIYLGLYLTDSVAKGRFVVGAVWAAILFAVLAGFMNSFIRPLPRIRKKPARAGTIAALTLAANILLLQIFVWITPLRAANLAWVLLVAAFVVVLTGVINWLVGFEAPAKERRTAALERIRKAPPPRQSRPRQRSAPRPRR